MGKRANIKIILIVLVLSVLTLSQFIPISRVLAASVSSGSEFFTARSDYCAGSGCDALLQYGFNSCVESASASDFYAKAPNGGEGSFNNANGNYSLDNYAEQLLTILLAYYYGVDPSQNHCSVQENFALPSGDIYSLDNIGAAFDILQIAYGASVPAGDFTYNPTGPLGPYVTLGSGVISDFIDTLVTDSNNKLVCPPKAMAETVNTAIDVRKLSFDVGRAPITTGRSLIGILNPNLSTSCSDTTSTDYQLLMDVTCGNISDTPVHIIPTSPTAGTCSISDSSNGSATVGTAVTFSLTWHLPKPQATEINSATVTSNISSSNVAPSNIRNGALTTTVGYNEVEPTTDSPVDPTSAEAINYAGSMSVQIPGDSPVTQAITCTSDSVTWTAPSSACLNATNAANVASTNLATAQYQLVQDQYAYNQVSGLLSYDQKALANDQTTVANDNTALYNAEQAYANGPNKGDPNLLKRVNQDKANLANDLVIRAGDAAAVAYDEGVISNNSTAIATDNANITTDSNAYNAAVAAEQLACGGGPVCPPGELGTPPNCYLPPPTCPPNCPPPTCPPNCPPPTCPPNCPGQPAGPESYFSVNGGDTIVGTGFGDGSCTDDLSAGIVASNIGSAPWTGSSDNLSTLAPDIINGLSTGSGGDALTFANTTNSPYGGSFGSTNGLCSQDYYSTSQNVSGFTNLTSATGTFNLASVDTNTTNCAQFNSVYYCKLTGPIAISGNPLPGSKVVIYVSGNAEIAGTGINIYSNYSDTLTSASSIPVLYIISNANIYIDSTVTSLDGIYVADNLGATDKTDNGIIFTCANAGNSFSSGSALVSGCNTQLTINGALVASQIKFGRTYGDITTANGSSVAPSETDNYGPEVWLSQLGNSNLPINPNYQDITELSPVI